jgi:hypothetical protein
MQISVPIKRLKETHRMACRLLRLVQAQQNDTDDQMTRPTIKTRVLACMVGRIVPTFRGIRGARRHLIFLQHALGQAVRRSGWNSVTPLSLDAIHTLAWWASDHPWKRNGCQMIPELHNPIQVSIRSDAATETLGWGGTLQVAGQPPVATRGYFTADESKLHINALELLGCWFTVKSLLPRAIPHKDWSLTHVNCELCIDNAYYRYKIRTRCG